MTMRLEVIGGIARLLIDQPLKRNAMSTAMFELIPKIGRAHV